MSHMPESSRATITGLHLPSTGITLPEESHVGEGGSGTATDIPVEGRNPAMRGHTPSDEEASGDSRLTEDGSPHVPLSSSSSAVVTLPTSTVTVAIPTTSTTMTAGTSPSVSFSGSADIMGTVTQLLQAQTEVMAAQARATTVQHLPPLPSIQEMDLTIQHKAGKKNSNADALSRNPVEDSTIGAVAVD